MSRLLLPGLILAITVTIHAADRDLELAQQWVNAHLQARKARADNKKNARALAALPPPVKLSSERELKVLEAGLRGLASPQGRLTILKPLIERHPGHALPILTRTVNGEKDPGVRKWLLLLIGLYRDKDTAELLRRHLRSQDAGVRAAAADALGLLHRPAYRIPLSRGYLPGEDTRLACGGDGIDLTDLVAWSHYAGKIPSNVRSTDEAIKQDRIELPEEFRRTIQEMMIQGTTPEERTAAARALSHWPPKDYRFRIAEWGVWLSDQGELQCVQSVLDEIPPFVHRTGDPADSLQKRVNQIMIITKPVLHITTSAPLAVDMEVQIKFGRPWFAYPRPDDFGLTVGTEYGFGLEDETKLFLSPLDHPRLPALADAGEGYPWLTGRHRRYGAIGGGMGAIGNQIADVGLRWQSLIVTPERCRWMRPPAVPGDERFQWWKDLRDAPCAWVSSRGEAERFLYYDGPTLAQTPLCIDLLDKKIRAVYTPMFPKSAATSFSFDGQKIPQSRKQDATPDSQRYRGMYVEVQNGQATAHVPELPTESEDVPLPLRLSLRDRSVEDKWVELLCASGLTREEAQALTRCWRKQFFETDGRRFLLILRADDYDEMCPLWVEPKPTALVRVGVVLKEFGVPSSGPKLSAAQQAVLRKALRKLEDDEFRVREQAQATIFGLGSTALPSLYGLLREELPPEVRMRLSRVATLLETLGWPQRWQIAGEKPDSKRPWKRPPIEPLNENRYVVDPSVVLGDRWKSATVQTSFEWPFEAPATLWFCSKSKATILLNGTEVALPKKMPTASCPWRRKPAAVQVPIRRGTNSFTVKISRKWYADGSFYLRVTPADPDPSVRP